MDDITADIIRKAMLQEAAGIDGLGTHVPSPSSIWRYPYWPTHDVGYEEEQ